MSAIVTLPPALRRRMAAIRRRARLLRLVCGIGWLGVLLGLSGLAAILIDYGFDLSPQIRQLLLPAWLAVGTIAFLLGVLVPFFRRIDTRALAAIVERKYPDLGERLTSTVELSEAEGDGYGSPAFIALLMEETDRQSAPLDFRVAVASRRAGVLAAVALGVAVVAAAPALLWPGPYGDLLQRFFQPWYVPPAVVPYTLAVAPGDAVAGQGRTVALSAHLIPRNDSTILPQECALITIDNDGNEARQPMQRDENGDFTLSYRLSGAVSYRMEAGEAVSDTYRLTAIAPVELAADSPRITVTPPTYAQVSKAEETLRGLVDFSVLRHSRIRFDFRFNRPAAAAQLEWEGQGKQNQTVTHPLSLSADRQSAQLDMKAIEGGKYRLILSAEHDIRTTLSGGAIRVVPDQPPAVRAFSGREETRTVLPYERVPLELAVADDIAVAGVELELRINDGAPKRRPLELTGGNTPSAIARHVLELDGMVRDDDRLSYRFHVRDNLPKEFGGPNRIVYPVDRWLTLRVARRGDPLRQKEIVMQRNRIDLKLEAIKAALMQEKRGVYKVRQETRRQQTLQAHQTAQIRDLQRDNQNNQSSLRDLGESTRSTPELQPLGDLLGDIADRQMQQSGEQLEQAPNQRTPSDRARRFDKADAQLDTALQRLEEAKKANEKLAQQRLDRVELEALADREKQLAEQAEALAAQHPVLDPKTKEKRDQLQRRQAETAADLDRLTQRSQPLREAAQSTRQEQAKKKAEQLEKEQSDLNKAQSESQQRKAKQLAEFAQKQKQLAEQEAKLGQQTKQQAKAAHTQPLRPEEPRRAANDLQRGKLREAIPHQTETAHDLDRLAAALERTSAERQQKALQEIGRLRQKQEEIFRQVEPIKKDDADAARALAEAARRQAEVAEALHKMDALDQPARRERAADAANRALVDLMDRRREDVPATQREARRQLERLEQALRGQKPVDEKARDLARRQRELADEAARAAADPKTTTKKKQDLQRRQQQIAEQTQQLQAPEAPQRHRQAVEATRQAAKATQAKPGEPRTRQRMQEAARKLDELARQMEGQESDVERAERLARQQSEEAAQTERQPSRASRAEAQQRTRDIAHEAREIRGGEEARQEKQSAADALARARQASAKDQPGAQRQAADALRKLADRLAGRPSPSRDRQGASKTAQSRDQEGTGKKPPAGARGSASPVRTTSAKMPYRSPRQMAQQFAQQQRQLAKSASDASQKGSPQKAMQQLANQQEQLNQQTSQLPAAGTQRALEQARAAMNKAKDALATADVDRARRKQNEAADALDRLAAKLPAQVVPAPPPDASSPLPSKEQIQEVRRLAKQQRELREAVRRADAASSDAPSDARQRELQQRTSELMRDFDRLAQEEKDSPEAQAAWQRATAASQDAHWAMQQARSQGQQGRAEQAEQSRRQAQQSLQRAARQAAQAAETPSPRQSGISARKARQQMAEAQGQLQRGQPGQARQAMQKAAQALEQAAQQMGTNPQQPGQVSGNGRKPGGLPDLRALGLAKTPYAGKSWGELPGELRTKIVQDLKASYGEDYARAIKLYFEQIAATSRPKAPTSGATSAPPRK